MNTLNKILLLTFASAVAFSSAVNAQQGFGTSAPDKSAVIDMTATNKGLLVPRIALTSTTDVTTIPTPADALTVFNTATVANTAPFPQPTNGLSPGYYFYSTSINRWTPMQDIRKFSANNHISSDAGVDGNGTSIGPNALYNISIGSYSLSSNSNGSYNVALGLNTLKSNITGRDNISLGTGTLSSNTKGSFNIALGNAALQSNILGTENIAIGRSALSAYKAPNNDFSGNIAIGPRSLGVFETGYTNIAIGNGSGSGLITGSNNIFIGNDTFAILGTTVSNQLNFNNWIFGDNGNISIGLGTGLPVEKFEVATGNVRIRDINTVVGTSTDKIVVADANGILKTLKATDFDFSSLPIFDSNVAASSVATGHLYQTTTGEIRIKLPSP